ncbi:glycosyltransferase [Histidinibacterium aquaticum]|uniref:Rhamnosyl transferase n=1 Tax=Histidinibacterium aquaticum TaxID=2613962 RepID=A0A5J5G9Y2_9RHOB|nr:glycosyltransferase [Histidinibacterium aquaticum]KAA9004771.1 hypothetical protein F3S47_19130 [Histidinibacterium aquaticum]
MLQVLGLCRFSYPALQGFQTAHDDIEARRAALYDPARLDLRLTWFEHVCLPGLANQTNPHWTLLLLLGDDFPEPWRSRLEALIAEVPQIVPVYRPPGNHRAVCGEVLRAARDRAATWVAEVRMDDDDAVATDFVERLRADWPRVRPFAEEEGLAAVDYQRGVVLEAGPGKMTLHPRVARYWGTALALILRRDDARSMMDFPHHRVWWRMPTITRHKPMIFVRGSHATNDSHINLRETITLEMKSPAVERVLKTRFAIDLPAFRSALDRLSAEAERS